MALLRAANGVMIDVAVVNQTGTTYLDDAGTGSSALCCLVLRQLTKLKRKSEPTLLLTALLVIPSSLQFGA